MDHDNGINYQIFSIHYDFPTFSSPTFRIWVLCPYLMGIQSTLAPPTDSWLLEPTSESRSYGPMGDLV